MAHHGPVEIDELDKTPIGAKALPARTIALGAAVVGLVLLVTGLFGSGAGFVGGGFKRIMFAYLIGYAFFLALTVGSLALVILTTLFRAGWVVAVRRVPETFAANFLFVGALGLPILFVAVFGNGMLYPWSQDMESFGPEMHEAEEFLHHLHAEHEGDADHAEDAEPGNALAADSDTQSPSSEHETLYVAAQAGDAAYIAAADDADPAHGADAYREHAHDPAQPGDAYPEDRELALKIQRANYLTLLGYMLDYKAYGGKLDGEGLIPLGKGWHWYSPLAFAVRLLIYLAVFTAMGVYYWKKSVAQDESGDPNLTSQREWWAPLSTLGFALAITFCAFDLLMSLDPAWYSTMFGVIFFANSFLGGIALTIIVCLLLQKRGFLKTVNVEHYHDLGKLLFAMTFFWGYVSFSQYMLIWYASLPETTYWFEIRGATTVSTAPQYGSGWSWIILILLFGHLILPFGFLLSKHVKRNLTLLCGAAVWLLAMIYLDLYWYIMPVFANMIETTSVIFGLPEIGAVLLLGGAVAWKFLGRYAQHAPLAHKDPRIHETTALDTSVWAPIHH